MIQRILFLLPLLGVLAQPATSVEPPLRAGIAADYEPLVFRRGGDVVGLEPDLAAQLAKDLGREVQLVETPWKRLVPDLLAGRIDVVMAGLPVTDERARQVRFTDPYLQIGQMALVGVADIARFPNREALLSTASRVGFGRCAATASMSTYTTPRPCEGLAPAPARMT